MLGHLHFCKVYQVDISFLKSNVRVCFSDSPSNTRNSNLRIDACTGEYQSRVMLSATELFSEDKSQVSHLDS